jgi:drug/metabolite transporter (DMT)-like permease
MSNKGKSTIVYGVVLTLISAAGFSVYPILGKYVFARGAGLSTVLLVRFALSALFFWMLTIRLEGVPKLSLKTWLTLWGLGGIGYSLMAGFYLGSVQYIPASLASLLLYAYPMIVTILSVLTRQEKISSFKISGLVISTLGLILVLGVALEGINFIGVMLALSAAIVYAVYIVVGNRVLKRTTPLVSATMISTSAALTYGVVGLLIGGMTWKLSLSTWIGICGIAVFSAIIAILAFFGGMKYIGATSASIISTMEPVMTVLLAVFLLGEHLSLIQLFGGVFVILGGILAVIPPRPTKISTDHVFQS